jgi:hypothetical protein
MQLEQVIEHELEIDHEATDSESSLESNNKPGGAGQTFIVLLLLTGITIIIVVLSSKNAQRSIIERIKAIKKKK